MEGNHLACNQFWWSYNKDVRYPLRGWQGCNLLNVREEPPARPAEWWQGEVSHASRTPQMSARPPRTRSLSLVVINARRLILLRAMATSITAIPLGRHIPQRAASSLDAPAVGRMPLLGIIRLAISVRALQAKSLLVERELIEVLPQVTCGDPREDLGWQFRSVSSALTRNAPIDPLEQVRVLAEVSISFVAGSGQVFSCSSAYRLGPLGGH